MDDSISRQLLGTDLATKRTVKGFPIDADMLMLKVEEEYGFRARDRLYEIIRCMPKYDLPFAQPQRMRGRWEDAHRYGWSGTYWFIKCNNCGYERKDDNHDLDAEYKFCPNCGARMEGGTDAAD